MFRKCSVCATQGRHCDCQVHSLQEVKTCQRGLTCVKQAQGGEPVSNSANEEEDTSDLQYNVRFDPGKPSNRRT